MWQRNVDCLGVTVSIASEVAEIDKQLTAVFRTYADATSPPDVSYRMLVTEWPTLQCDNGWTRRCDSVLDLVPALELDLYTQVAARAQGLVLHAAAVVGVDRRALVFPGVSGAGKSTLLRSLLLHGYDYMSEECVALRADGTCIGLARALHVDDDRVEVPAAFACDEYTLRGATGLRTTRLFHPPATRVWRGSAPVAAIVCLSHAPDANDELVRLGAGEAVMRAWPMVLRPRLDDVPPAGLPPSFALHSRTAARALERVLMLADELGVHAR